jgi:hypothetical protein
LRQRLSGFAEGLVAPDALIVAFDQFEDSLGLLLADEAWAPISTARSTFSPPGGGAARVHRPVVTPSRMHDWPSGEALARFRIFAASPERLDEAKERYDAWVAQERMRSRIGYR